MSPQTVLGFIHSKKVEIRPAESPLRVNKIKISNHCLGRGNEPFILLIKIHQSAIRLGSFRLEQSKHVFYGEYSGV